MRTPKTDDIQRPAVYVVMIIAAAGIAIGVSLYRKYRKKEERKCKEKEALSLTGDYWLTGQVLPFSIYKTFRDMESAHAQSFGL